MLLVSRLTNYGGYRVARPASNISLAVIGEAIEGLFSMTECSIAESHCDCSRGSECCLPGSWQKINIVLDNARRAVSLGEMLKPQQPRRKIAVTVTSEEAITE
jgi:DNA-binding IscR family transcriptional regulator